MILALHILGWIVCGVASYFIGRALCRNEGFEWTVGTRRGMILHAIFGPLSLLATAILWFCLDDRPAKR